MNLFKDRQFHWLSISAMLTAVGSFVTLLTNNPEHATPLAITAVALAVLGTKED